MAQKQLLPAERMKSSSTLNTYSEELLRALHRQSDFQSALRSSTTSKRTAIPLCLPNNCHWDERTKQYSTIKNTPRTSLRTVEAALTKLRAIKDPVCVVSIVGPCRRGKSYILSKIFEQGAVFPLGHSMDPETMGMWTWIVPEKFTDPTTGREFTVVLLDSEGTDAVGSKGNDDCAIFTLAVLLSSIMIYNSVGVPRRTDLEEFQKNIKLSQRIQVLSGESLDQSDSKKVFPSLVWLLRDVTLSLPKEFPDLRSYFVEKVFSRSHASSSATDVVDMIELFKEFDAFRLPPPSLEPQVVQHMDKREKEASTSFLRAVQQFKEMVKSMLTPNRTLSDGFITGEGLAMLIEQYVATLNKPNVVPCVQDAWKGFVETKCHEGLQTSLNFFRAKTEKIKFPCDEKKLREIYDDTCEVARQLIHSAADGLLVTNEKCTEYCETLEEKAKEIFNEWEVINVMKTEESCREQEEILTEKYLKPLLDRLWQEEMQHIEEIEDYDMLKGTLMSAYSAVLEWFDRTVKGCRDVCIDIYNDLATKLDSEEKENLRLIDARRKADEEWRSEELARTLEQDNVQHARERKATTERQLKMNDNEIKLLKRK